MIYQESQNATIPQPPAGALSLEDASEAQTLTLKIEDFKAVPVVQIPGPTCHQQADLGGDVRVGPGR